MADRLDIDFSQIEEIQKLLDSPVTRRQTANVMRSTVHAMAGEIRNDVRAAAPQDSRVLSKSIRSRRVRTDFATGEFGSDVTIDGQAFYWRFIEYGTKHHSADPFIRRAVDGWVPTAARSLRSNFGKKLEALMRRQAKKRGV